MTALVIAEHDNSTIKPATLNAISAAAQCGGHVHVLVAGFNATAAVTASTSREKCSSTTAATPVITKLIQKIDTV